MRLGARDGKVEAWHLRVDETSDIRRRKAGRRRDEKRKSKQVDVEKEKKDH